MGSRHQKKRSKKRSKRDRRRDEEPTIAKEQNESELKPFERHYDCTSKVSTNPPFPLFAYTDRNFIDTHRTFEIERDILDFFVQDSESSTPCWDAELIRKFCRSGASGAATDAKTVVLLRDREYGTGKSRDHPEVLNSVQLRQALNELRYGHKDLVDASRRQILVKNLNSDAVSALVETAACHQVDTLRDTISKHISGETSIKVQREVDGLDRPRLELHLPYLALRKVSQVNFGATSSTSQQETGSKPLTSFYVPDLAVLGREQGHRYVIHESHISLVLCAWDHTKWTVYAFSKPCPENIQPQVEPEDDDTSDDGEDDPTDDILAPDNGALNLSADQTIYDPRRYFIRMAAIWIAFVLQEYTYLVQTLDANVKAWRIEARNSASEALCSGKRDRFDAKKLFTNIQEMKQLLREVREHMLPAIRAWEAFTPIDLPFFADLQDRGAKSAINNMRSSFGKLVDLAQKLSFLDLYFAEVAKDLELQLHLESYDLSHHAHELNMKTNLLSRETRELNRTSTDAAIANMKVAEKTNSTTQRNVLLIWLTTPIILVLQYFGADRPIFAFERNPRSFVLALVVVFLALPLLTYLLSLVEHLKEMMLLALGTKKSKRKRTSNTIDASGTHLQPISLAEP